MEHCSTNIYPYASILFAAGGIELNRVYSAADVAEMLFYGSIREYFMLSSWFKLKRAVGTSRLLENIGSTPDWRAEALQADRHDKMLMKSRTKRARKMILASSQRQQIEDSQKEMEKARGRQ